MNVIKITQPVNTPHPIDMQKSQGFSTKTQYDTVMIVLLFACHMIVFKVFALKKVTFYQ